MRLLRWRGGYTDLSTAALAAYHSGLQITYGFTAVGLPVRRTFGVDGVFAVAAYQEGIVALRARGGVVRIVMHLERQVDFEALKQFTVTSFGLKSAPDTGRLSEIEDIES